ETGLVGAICVTCIGVLLHRAWRRSHHSYAFAAFAGVWIVGILVTTSYFSLLPIWVALAWLTVWPEVCHPATGHNPLAAPYHPDHAAALPVSPRYRSAWRPADAAREDD